LSDRVAAHHASDQQLRHIGVAQAIQTISHGGEPSPPRLSIVVLPLVNVGNDPEQHSNLVNGITEDLTTDLSRLESMLVISRNTALTYRDRPVDTSRIGRELGVRYVLNGSVQQSGKQVRVTARWNLRKML
jgi:adenylate cyclase